MQKTKTCCDDSAARKSTPEYDTRDRFATLPRLIVISTVVLVRGESGEGLETVLSYVGDEVKHHDEQESRRS